jgi:hypothetical protein
MFEKFDEAECTRIQQDQVVIAQSIGEIFDDAIASGDLDTLDRILNTYEHGYLGDILGGYPEYLDEVIKELG